MNMKMLVAVAAIAFAAPAYAQAAPAPTTATPDAIQSPEFLALVAELAEQVPVQIDLVAAIGDRNGTSSLKVLFADSAERQELKYRF